MQEGKERVDVGRQKVGKERDECMQVTKEGMQEESKYVGDERVIQVDKVTEHVGRY